MKVLTTTGLTKLIELSKDTFLNKNNIVDISDALASVALSGSYADLSNKPSINSVSLSGNKTSANLGLQDTLVGSGTGQNIKTVNNNNLLGSGNINIDSLPTQSGNSGKFLTTNGTTASWATLATVATTGSYNSLSNKLTAGTDIAISNSNVISSTHPEVHLTNLEYQALVNAGTTDANTYYNTDVEIPGVTDDIISIRSSMSPGDTLKQGYMALVEV